MKPNHIPRICSAKYWYFEYIVGSAPLGPPFRSRSYNEWLYFRGDNLMFTRFEFAFVVLDFGGSHSLENRKRRKILTNGRSLHDRGITDWKICPNETKIKGEIKEGQIPRNLISTILERLIHLIHRRTEDKNPIRNIGKIRLNPLFSITKCSFFGPHQPKPRDPTHKEEAPTQPTGYLNPNKSLLNIWTNEWQK